MSHVHVTRVVKLRVELELNAIPCDWIHVARFDDLSLELELNAILRYVLRHSDMLCFVYTQLEFWDYLQLLAKKATA